MWSISEMEGDWLKRNYPDLSLRLEVDSWEITGRFVFSAAWDGILGKYIINPTYGQGHDLMVISDAYKVKLSFDETVSFPRLFELEGRIEARARSLNLAPKDLHVYEGGEACMVGSLDHDLVDSIPSLLDGPVLQFFHDQSYHERTGQWPRGQYMHGLWGLVENFFDRYSKKSGDFSEKCLREIFIRTDSEAVRLQHILKSGQRIRGHHLCICASGRRIRDCHNTLFRGLWTLQDMVRMANTE